MSNDHSMISELTDATFSDFTATGTTLVYFWSTMCGPCRQQGPIVEQLARAEQDADRIRVAKLDADACPTTGRAQAIHFLPMIKIFRDGKELSVLRGMKSIEDLQAEINQVFDA